MEMENNEEQKIEEQEIYTINDKVDENGYCLLIKRDSWGKGDESSPHVEKYTLDIGKFSIEYIAEYQRWISAINYRSAPDYDESERASIAMKINDRKLARALGLGIKPILQSGMREGIFIFGPHVGEFFNTVMRYMFALDYFMSTAHKTIYGIDTPKKFRNYSNPVGDKIYKKIITAFREKIRSFFGRGGFKNINDTEDAQQFLDNQFKEHNLAGPLYTINQVQETIVGPYLERIQEKNKRQYIIDQTIEMSMPSKDDQSFLLNLAAKLKSIAYRRLVTHNALECLRGKRLIFGISRRAVRKAAQRAVDDLERNN